MTDDCVNLIILSLITVLKVLCLGQSIIHIKEHDQRMIVSNNKLVLLGWGPCTASWSLKSFTLYCIKNISLFDLTSLLTLL